MELPRLTRWLRRYGPAEVTGIGTALLGSYAVHALTGNEIAADGWVVAQLGTGQVVGEYGMFGPGRRTATVVSNGASKALALHSRVISSGVAEVAPRPIPAVSPDRPTPIPE